MKWSGSTKQAAILGWRGLQVTVIKLTFCHPGRPGDCQINNNKKKKSSVGYFQSVHLFYPIQHEYQKCILKREKKKNHLIIKLATQISSFTL